MCNYFMLSNLSWFSQNLSNFGTVFALKPRVA
jgi:hypothetical protein